MPYGISKKLLYTLYFIIAMQCMEYGLKNAIVHRNLGESLGSSSFCPSWQLQLQMSYVQLIPIECGGTKPFTLLFVFMWSSDMMQWCSYVVARFTLSVSL